MQEQFKIGELARGALNERADVEVQRVLENINDKNTSWKKSRKVTLTLEFKANDENRDSVSVSIQAKSSIAPYSEVTTQLWLGKDNSGNIIAEEYVKGALPGQVVVDTSIGEIVDPKESKVVNLKNSRG